VSLPKIGQFSTHEKEKELSGYLDPEPIIQPPFQLYCGAKAQLDVKRLDSDTLATVIKT
jgi:hypothetical protein